MKYVYSLEIQKKRKFMNDKKIIKLYLFIIFSFLYEDELKKNIYIIIISCVTNRNKYKIKIIQL